MKGAIEIIDTEGYVLINDGKPVSIEDGEMLWWFGDDGEHWNSETLQFEDDEEDDDEDDRELYGMDWYDCN